MALFRKDASLDRLADDYNVAQFVSFSPADGKPDQQFSRVAGYKANHKFKSLNEAVSAILGASSAGSVNIRSFTATDTKSREFIYGLTKEHDVVSNVERLTSDGSFTIINETIDVSDGGVSGVVFGDVVEFRPDATPRGVESSGFASMPKTWAEKLLKQVYGFDPGFPDNKATRLEFSIHPRKSGWLNTHTLFWEAEDYGSSPDFKASISWPNDFSRLIGDKAFGLMIAWLSGVAVPATTVVSRRIAPFSFGTSTGSYEKWMRTCPVEQQPGFFTTTRGWTDPFSLLSVEDPSNASIASILSQDSVEAQWSGALIEDSEGAAIVEGVAGFGDQFMQGDRSPEQLPKLVTSDVLKLHQELGAILGPVRFEWAHDGSRVWILQLHVGRSVTSNTELVPGNAEHWVHFKTSEGLEALRRLISTTPSGVGIILEGSVGLTSHFADVVRKSAIPTRIS